MQTFLKGLWYYAEYQSFRIESEANFYRLYVAGYTAGNAGDSLANITAGLLTVQNGMNFSSHDVDNDMKDGGSCSALFNSASWWYNNCLMACLTGPYNTKSFIWLSLQTYGTEGGQGRLRAARMMIRRI